MAKQPKTGVTPTVHAAKANPAGPKKKLDPCRHRRKKKKQVFVVYMARETGSSPPKYYIGRTRGPGTVTQAINNRERGHHRTDIGSLRKVCEQKSYSACRGAEQLHYLDMVAKGHAITKPRKKGKGKQIAPISADNTKKDDYVACAKAEATPSPPGCDVCAA
jgi:hypothetical protein